MEKDCNFDAIEEEGRSNSSSSKDIKDEMEMEVAGELGFLYVPDQMREIVAAKSLLSALRN